MSPLPEDAAQLVVYKIAQTFSTVDIYWTRHAKSSPICLPPLYTSKQLQHIKIAQSSSLLCGLATLFDSPVSRDLSVGSVCVIPQGRQNKYGCIIFIIEFPSLEMIPFPIHLRCSDYPQGFDANWHPGKTM